MIRFRGAGYANELYDGKGDNVYTLEDAIAAAEEQYGPTGWEVYNGQEGESRFED
jgi:hypothetical protein